MGLPIVARVGSVSEWIHVLKGHSQLEKGRPIHSNDCGKYLLCQLDHAQQRESYITLHFRHKFICSKLMVRKLVT